MAVWLHPIFGISQSLLTKCLDSNVSLINFGIGDRPGLNPELISGPVGGENQSDVALIDAGTGGLVRTLGRGEVDIGGSIGIFCLLGPVYTGLNTTPDPGLGVEFLIGGVKMAGDEIRRLGRSGVS